MLFQLALPRLLIHGGLLRRLTLLPLLLLKRGLLPLALLFLPLLLLGQLLRSPFEGA